ncbi:hypothetical protein R1flu_012162 [Riccia fluitans]|uniref:Uncharacterized protein n=1 Tax=Riccia fluitans TaxID=41844 RepID=A0ABD1ZA21_9MARC
MIDAFLRENELELQNLARFLIEVRTKTENLFYHLEVDWHRRRQPPAYLDEDAPIVGIFLKFVDCFKTTVNELQLERERALHLPKDLRKFCAVSEEHQGPRVVSLHPARCRLKFVPFTHPPYSRFEDQDATSSAITEPLGGGRQS